VDTDDLVQTTLARAFSHLEGFEQKGEGAFLAYLRQILLNRLRDEARRVLRRPDHQELPADLLDGEPTPIDQAIGRETRERYERALARLSEDQMHAVVLKVEFGYTNQQLGEALERPVNAARMVAARGLVRLVELMREGERSG
jgi:RNA polymerase sigma-70 factor (ECF subfamily)